jgi:hypothetical protein
MLSNERFALACRAYYDEIGLVVDATNGEFAHSPLTRKECDTGYYLLWEDHQHQGLLQSKDLGKCCFFSGHTRKWLEELDYFPDDYFELWDIYEKYSSEHSQKMNRELHSAKDENGKSLHSLKLHKEKNKDGKSLLSLKAHEAKDENGKSVNAVKAASKTHETKDENGKSLHSLMMNKKVHEAKDENGKSLHTMKNLKKIHEAKDENGKSLLTLRINAQVWESTVDGFRSNAGNVAQYNKARGWDPAARIRIS